MNAAIFKQVWYHICFVLGLSGNLFVLYGSIVHKAIKLDDMSLWIIRNLAVTDLLNCLCLLLPMLMSQYAGNIWIFGDSSCKISRIFRWTFTCANIFLINALSINKLYRCVFPLNNLVPSIKRKSLVTIFTIIFSLMPSIYAGVRLATESSGTDQLVLYHPSRSSCEFKPYNSSSISPVKMFQYILLILLLAVPNLTLILSNTVLIGYAAKKTNTRINKRNVLIVILVTASFSVSFLPMLVVLGIRIRGTPRDFAWSMVFFSAWINPFIYMAVNTRFRAYTKDAITFWRKKNQVAVVRTS